MNSTDKQQHFQEYLSFALKIAKEAGQILMKYYESNLEAKEKDNIANNLVTQADLDSEKHILSAIKKVYPKHSILAEESGAENKESDYLWVVDPLDGTNNFYHGLPHFAVNIALTFNGKPIVAVTHAPKLNETFYATQDGGAFLDNKKIQVSSHKNISESLMATGFPPDRNSIEFNKSVENATNLLRMSHGIRRMGSAAIDMAYIACGRLDGFFEINLAPWDIAAGILIVEEAKGKITDYDNKSLDIYTKSIVASNGLIHDELTNKLDY